MSEYTNGDEHLQNINHKSNLEENAYNVNYHQNYSNQYYADFHPVKNVFSDNVTYCQSLPHNELSLTSGIVDATSTIVDNNSYVADNNHVQKNDNYPNFYTDENNSYYVPYNHENNAQLHQQTYPSHNITDNNLYFENYPIGNTIHDVNQYNSGFNGLQNQIPQDIATPISLEQIHSYQTVNEFDQGDYQNNPPYAQPFLSIPSHYEASVNSIEPNGVELDNISQSENIPLTGLSMKTMENSTTTNENQIVFSLFKKSKKPDFTAGVSLSKNGPNELTQSLNDYKITSQLDLREVATTENDPILDKDLIPSVAETLLAPDSLFISSQSMAHDENLQRLVLPSVELSNAQPSSIKEVGGQYPEGGIKGELKGPLEKGDVSEGSGRGRLGYRVNSGQSRYAHGVDKFSYRTSRPLEYRGARRDSLASSHLVISDVEADNDSYVSDAPSFLGGGGGGRRQSRYQRYFAPEHGAEQPRRGRKGEPNYNTDAESHIYPYPTDERRIVNSRHHQTSRRKDYDSHYEEDDGGSLRYYDRSVPNFNDAGQSADRRRRHERTHGRDPRDDHSATFDAGVSHPRRRQYEHGPPSAYKDRSIIVGSGRREDYNDYYHQQPGRERSDSRASSSMTRDSFLDKSAKAVPRTHQQPLRSPRNETFDKKVYADEYEPYDRKGQNFKHEKSRVDPAYTGFIPQPSNYGTTASLQSTFIDDNRGRETDLKGKGKRGGAVPSGQLVPEPQNVVPGPGTNDPNSLYWQQYQMMAQNMYTNYYKMMATNYPQAMGMFFPGMVNPLEHLKETLEEEESEEETDSESGEENEADSPQNTIKEPLLYTRTHVVARFSPNGSLLVLMSTVKNNIPTQTGDRKEFQSDGDLSSSEWTDKNALVPGGKREQTLQIVDIQNFFKDIDNFKKYPGPLTKTDTHKDDVIKFCYDLIATHSKIYGPETVDTTNSSSVASSKQNIPNAIILEEESSRKIDPAMVTRCRRQLPSSFELLVRYLLLSIKQNGAVVGADVSKILVSCSDEIDLPTLASKLNGSTGKLHTVLPSKINPTNLTSTLTPDEYMAQFREILLCGHQKEALDFALKHHSWGHAFYLASQMDTRIMTSITNKFLNTLSFRDPILTLYQTLAGKESSYINQMQSAPSNKPNPSEWRSHLAMILANPTSHSSKDRKNIDVLGDILAQNGDLPASHFCYLLAHEAFGHFGDKASKIVLLTAATNISFKKFASPDPIRLTEIFEYIDQLASRRMLSDTATPQKLRAGSSFLPHLQLYKFIYCTWLIDRGMVNEAFRYLEIIASAIVLQPHYYNPILIQNIFQFASRLKYMDPHTTYQDEAPSIDFYLPSNPKWLSDLGELIRSRIEKKNYVDSEPFVTEEILPPEPVSSSSVPLLRGGAIVSTTLPSVISAPTPPNANPLPFANFADFRFQKNDQAPPLDNRMGGKVEHKSILPSNPNFSTNLFGAANSQHKPSAQTSFVSAVQNDIDPRVHATSQAMQPEENVTHLPPVQFFNAGHQVSSPLFPPSNILPPNTSFGNKYPPSSNQSPQVSFEPDLHKPSVAISPPSDMAKNPNLSNYQSPLQQFGHFDNTYINSRPNKLALNNEAQGIISRPFNTSTNDRHTFDSYQISNENGMKNQEQFPSASYGKGMPHSQTFPTVKGQSFGQDSAQEESFSNSSMFKDEGAPTRKSNNKTSLDGSIAGSNSGGKGWFGGIIKKMLPKVGTNEMILPDDKEKSIVWNDALKRWENSDGTTPADEMTPPPPTDKELYMYAHHHNSYDEQAAPRSTFGGQNLNFMQPPMDNSLFNQEPLNYGHISSNIPPSSTNVNNHYPTFNAMTNNSGLPNANIAKSPGSNPSNEASAGARRPGKSPYIDVFAKSQKTPSMLSP